MNRAVRAEGDRRLAILVIGRFAAIGIRVIIRKMLQKGHKDPAPTIGVLELGKSSVNFAVRPWVKTSDYWDVFFATQQSIKKQFDAKGIRIPFPHQEVHLHKVD